MASLVAARSYRALRNDVTEGTVEIFAIIPKSETQEWLKQYGESP